MSNSKDTVAKKMLADFIALRVKVENNSVHAEQNTGVTRYLDCVEFQRLLAENADTVTKDGKAYFVDEACKAVNWSKSRLYQFLPIVDMFNVSQWVELLQIVPVSTAIFLAQDSKVEKAHSSYNRGDILRYVSSFYNKAPQYIKNLKTALPCALKNGDAENFVKGFIEADCVNEKTVAQALRDYHKPVVVEPVVESVVDTDTDTDTDTSGIQETVLEESAKMRKEIDDLRKQLAIANGDIEKANKALYKASHITVNGDTYLIDAKMRKTIIGPAIRKNAQDKGLEPIAVVSAKVAQAEKVEPVDRDKGLLEQFAQANNRKASARKGVQTKKTNRKNANKTAV